MIVADWQAQEKANGGQTGMTGRIPREAMLQRPDVVAQGADWYVVAKETGDLLASGVLKRPADNGGVLDLSVRAPASWAEGEVDFLLYWDDRYDEWDNQDSDTHRRAHPPEDAPTAAMGAAGNVDVGIHRYRVTFVTADGETAAGPRSEELDVTGGAKQVELTDIPRGPGFVTARKIYRTDAGGSTYGLVDTIGNNSATVYTDDVADADLGASSPTGFSRVEIDVSVEDEAIDFSVQRGANLTAEQHAGAVYNGKGQTIQRVKARPHKNRDAIAYTLRLYSADDEDAAFTLEQAWDCDDSLPGQLDVRLDNQNATVVRWMVRRESDGVEVDAFHLWLTGVKVFGIAPDEDFSVSDVARDVAHRIDCSTELVHEFAIPCGSLVVEGGTYGELLDLQALMAGARWLLYRRRIGDRCLDFRKFSARQWVLIDPEMPRGLLPQDQWSRAVIVYRGRNGRLRRLAEAVADPNPLRKRITQTFEVERRLSKEAAQQLAQRLADFGVTERRAGSATFTRVRDDSGRIWAAQFVRAGDQTYVPSEGLWLDVVDFDRHPTTCTATYPAGVPLLDRWKARHQRSD